MRARTVPKALNGTESMIEAFVGTRSHRSSPMKVRRGLVSRVRDRLPGADRHLMSCISLAYSLYQLIFENQINFGTNTHRPGYC